ncbi:MAG: filamentous hemagglutinin N-terminal domain-containing protein [Desulfococcaceae bacterium]
MKTKYFLMLLSWLLLPVSIQADVVTDGTVGPAQSLNGPDYQISHDLGKTAGQNLFHSFQQFSVSNGQSATFTGPDSIENVISRVTGGEISSIDGLLRSQIGTADFFFINPSGVVFGPNAQVDVPAAFHVSTADELRFADGNVFSATNPNTSTLTAAQPESFGYLSPQPASIVLNGSRLEFAPESKVSLTGGDVSLTGTTEQKAELISEAGEIRITAMGVQTGQVPVSGKADTEMKGKLTLESAAVEAGGNGGGHILIQAGEAETENTGIAANNTGSRNAEGGIDLLVNGNLTLTQETFIQSGALGEGDSGGVRISADGFLHLEDGSEIAVYTQAEGNSGDLNISAGNIQTEDSIFLSAALSGAKGNAGNITVQTNDLIIKGNNEQLTGILNQSQYGSFGNAGTVEITADGLLEICNGAEISGGTFSEGNAGSVKIQAGEIRIDGQGSDLLTGISCSAEPESAGNAGTVEVTTDGLLEVLNGAMISSSTFSEGNAGGVKIQAGNLKIDNQDSDSQFTRISSSTYSGSGNAGTLDITVTNLLELINGAKISSDTFGEGNAGSVKIQAGNLKIDDQGAEGQFTGIFSDTYSGSVGDAGSVDVTTDGLLEVLNGAMISSSTFSDGNAGSVKIQAGNLRIDGRGDESQLTGISSRTYSVSGNAGTVDITVTNLLELINGAKILSDTFGEGNAGSVKIQAGNLRIDGRGNESQLTGISSRAYFGSGNAGTLDITVTNLLELINGARISSDTSGEGHAGSVKIQAGNLKIDNQGSDSQFTQISSSTNSGSGNAGTLDITVTNLLELINGAQISSDTFGEGNAGGVKIHAGNLRIDGRGNESQLTGISCHTGSSGNAGTVDITVRNLLEMKNRAVISSFSAAQGNAGTINITVGSLLEMKNGAGIWTDTFAQGNAGNVNIQTCELKIDGQGSDDMTGIHSNAFGSGNAGTLNITVSSLLEILNGAAISNATHDGDGGRVTIHAGNLKIDGGAEKQSASISSDSFGSGNAGTVDITVGNHFEMLNGAVISSISGAQGHGGTVNITVDNVMEILSGAFISSNTGAQGNAGEVIIHAGDLKIDGQGFQDYATGIAGSAARFSSGNAGTVDITVDNLLEVLDGGIISGNTRAVGNAGEVKIVAGELMIDSKDSGKFTGIAGFADEYAGGYAGEISITADAVTVLNGGQISIAANQTLPEENLSDIPQTSIRIDTGQLYLDRNARITAESTGNVPAAAIHIQTGDLFIENSSRITTSAREADGGPISIQGETLILRDGLITTSVEGEAGNGGNITVSGMISGPADVLVFDGGFIQANTAAENARGGDIFIDAKAVIANNDSLEVGGTERQTFEPGSGRNIIQAAAPGGEQGTINITAPNLNISGSLINISSGFAAPVTPSEDPCRAAAGQNPSSLVLKGRGGLPPDPDHLSVPFFGKERLDRLREPDRKQEEWPENPDKSTGKTHHGLLCP